MDYMIAEANAKTAMRNGHYLWAWHYYLVAEGEVYGPIRRKFRRLAMECLELHNRGNTNVVAFSTGTGACERREWA